MADRDARSIGKRIRRLRLDRGLSQRDLTHPFVTPSYLSLIESGQRAASQQVLEVFAERLGVHVSEILTGRPASFEADLDVRLQRARETMYRGLVDEAEREVTGVLEDAGRAELSRLQARAFSVLGSVAERRDDWDAAESHFQRSLELWASEPVHLRFEALAGYARAKLAGGDPRYAVHLLESYLTELEDQKVPDPMARMRTYSALVPCYHSLGLRKMEAAAAEQARSLAPQVDDPEQLACTNTNVAAALMAQGRFDDALAASRDAERMYQLLDWTLPIAWTRLNQGFIELQKGNIDAARPALEGALELLDTVEASHNDRAEVLNELGRLERLSGNYDKARQHLEEARKELRHGQPSERGGNAQEFGLLLAEQGDYEGAETELRRAARIFRSVDATEREAETLMHLGRILRGQGELEAAVEILEQGLQLTLQGSIGSSEPI